MSRLFKIFECNDPKAAGGENLCIGIPVRIAGRDGMIPVSDSCRKLEHVVRAVKDIQDDLTRLLKEAEGILQPEALSESGLHFPPGMAPEEIWAVLKEMDGEEPFVKAFNQLEEGRRSQLAEHVLTQCNIFSGKAAVFSARYNSETGLLE